MKPNVGESGIGLGIGVVICLVILLLHWLGTHLSRPELSPSMHCTELMPDIDRCESQTDVCYLRPGSDLHCFRKF
jgi:hypothetical protein